MGSNAPPLPPRELLDAGSPLVTSSGSVSSSVPVVRESSKPPVLPPRSSVSAFSSSPYPSDIYSNPPNSFSSMPLTSQPTPSIPQLPPRKDLAPPNPIIPSGNSTSSQSTPQSAPVPLLPPKDNVQSRGNAFGAPNEQRKPELPPRTTAPFGSANPTIAATPTIGTTPPSSISSTPPKTTNPLISNEHNPLLKKPDYRPHSVSQPVAPNWSNQSNQTRHSYASPLGPLQNYPSYGVNNGPAPPLPPQQPCAFSSSSQPPPLPPSINQPYQYPTPQVVVTEQPKKEPSNGRTVHSAQQVGGASPGLLLNPHSSIEPPSLGPPPNLPPNRHTVGPGYITAEKISAASSGSAFSPAPALPDRRSQQVGSQFNKEGDNLGPPPPIPNRARSRSVGDRTAGQKIMDIEPTPQRVYPKPPTHVPIAQPKPGKMAPADREKYKSRRLSGSDTQKASITSAAASSSGVKTGNKFSEFVKGLTEEETPDGNYSVLVMSAQKTPVQIGDKKYVMMYPIEVSKGKQKWTVYRRYNQFVSLDAELKKHGLYKKANCSASLPPKDAISSKKDPLLLESRRRTFQIFLTELAKSPIIAESSAFHMFIQPFQMGDTKPTS